MSFKNNNCNFTFDYEPRENGFWTNTFIVRKLLVLKVSENTNLNSFFFFFNSKIKNTFKVSKTQIASFGFQNESMFEQ